MEDTPGNQRKLLHFKAEENRRLLPDKLIAEIVKLSPE